MKRYFSHYTFIYPDIFLKNYIVEVNDSSVITNVFPFEKEIEKTEFYPGILVFLPFGEPLKQEYFIVDESKLSTMVEINLTELQKTHRYNIYTDGCLLPFS
ncbi:hypothetical protein [Dysgonomonas sp. 511]|uniref:hypothetical protein n=1 Tax=Dysgonomonas sp. 511 TaxID=2302930 RepID=UPI0013D82E50|nr:hypothetical protein [Dysgonomonas sp. 511]NDV78529.1 hypothetical protein [Dysgonomonas sp. 511]